MNFAATHRALTQAVTWAGQRFGDDVFRIAPSLVEARASAPTEAFAVSAAKFRRCSYYELHSHSIQSLPEHFLENLHPHWLIPIAQLSSLFVPQKEKHAQILGLGRAKCSRGKSAGGCKSHVGSKSLFSCPCTVQHDLDDGFPAPGAPSASDVVSCSFQQGFNRRP